MLLKVNGLIPQFNNMWLYQSRPAIYGSLNKYDIMRKVFTTLVNETNTYELMSGATSESRLYVCSGSQHSANKATTVTNILITYNQRDKPSPISRLPSKYTTHLI